MTERLSFGDACRFLFPRQAGQIKWSLGPTQALLDVLGRPDREFPTIHVGGTNGKGSVCAYISADLEYRGFTTGLYTSPHLVSPRERVSVNGVPISEEAFAEWVSLLRLHIERLEASFFEAMTALALAHFAALRVDIAVIEVGLGGRLDATNVITPLATVVTKIALEHVDYLGSDLHGIAREKAGIAKPTVPFVTGENDAKIRATLVGEAVERGADPITLVDTEDPLPDDTRLGLRGRHQRGNARVALATLNRLPAPFGPAGPSIPPSFARAHAPGRFEVRGHWILEVAHNPDGFRVLVYTLIEHKPRRPVHAVVGIRKDKDWRAMLDLLSPAVEQLVLTIPPSMPAGQRWSWTEIAAWSTEHERRHTPKSAAVVFEEDFARALQTADQNAGTVLVTGSFHTVGDAMARVPGFATV
jgi:dihydrofolate synthase/folylpolyglutamate synthase